MINNPFLWGQFVPSDYLGQQVWWLQIDALCIGGMPLDPVNGA